MDGRIDGWMGEEEPISSDITLVVAALSPRQVRLIARIADDAPNYALPWNGANATFNCVNGTEYPNKNHGHGKWMNQIFGCTFQLLHNRLNSVTCGLVQIACLFLNLLIGRIAFPETFSKRIADDFQLCHLQVERMQLN